MANSSLTVARQLALSRHVHKSKMLGGSIRLISPYFSQRDSDGSI